MIEYIDVLDITIETTYTDKVTSFDNNNNNEWINSVLVGMWLAVRLSL